MRIRAGHGSLGLWQCEGAGREVPGGAAPQQGQWPSPAPHDLLRSLSAYQSVSPSVSLSVRLRPGRVVSGAVAPRAGHDHGHQDVPVHAARRASRWVPPPWMLPEARAAPHDAAADGPVALAGVRPGRTVAQLPAEHAVLGLGQLWEFTDMSIAHFQRVASAHVGFCHKAAARVAPSAAACTLITGVTCSLL